MKLPSPDTLPGGDLIVAYNHYVTSEGEIRQSLISVRPFMLFMAENAGFPRNSSVNRASAVLENEWRLKD
jgi:hypothetical protein